MEILKKKNIKVTSARKEILNIFLGSHEPMNAKDVFLKLNKHSSSKKLDEVTIYRNLTLFEGKGILKKVNLMKDSVYFESALDHHHHMVCVKCGLIEDFHNNKFEKLVEDIVEGSSRFRKIKEHSLEIFGFCKKCFV